MNDSLGAAQGVVASLVRDKAENLKNDLEKCGALVALSNEKKETVYTSPTTSEPIEAEKSRYTPTVKETIAPVSITESVSKVVEEPANALEEQEKQAAEQSRLAKEREEREKQAAEQARLAKEREEREKQAAEQARLAKEREEREKLVAKERKSIVDIEKTSTIIFFAVTYSIWAIAMGIYIWRGIDEYWSFLEWFLWFYVAFLAGGVSGALLGFIAKVVYKIVMRTKYKE